MNYEKMMEDSAAYINQHIREGLTAWNLAQIYSCTAGNFSYIFSYYYKVPLDIYISKVRLKYVSDELLLHTPAEDVAKKYRYESTEQLQEEFVREYGMTAETFVQKGEAIPLVNLQREQKSDGIQVEFKMMKPMTITGYPIVQEDMIEYNPIQKAVARYCTSKKNTISAKEPQIAIWWHDPECKSYYVMGTICKDREQVSEGMLAVSMPKSRYAVFSISGVDEASMEETMKNILYYVNQEWSTKNERKINKLGYTYELYEKNKVSLYLPLLEEKDQVPKEKIYGVNTWTKYIDSHITMNLTTQALAETFHYSATHFRRVFQEYYDMTVSDYIRKRRLQMVAEEIRSGAKYKNLAAKYNFKTYAGFARAFEKEFNMAPSAYSKGVFEVVDLEEYYKEYKGRLIISIVDIKEIKMIGHTVIPDRGEEVDIPSQIYYWMDKDFPCLENTRFSCNKRRREDKIAMWYHEPEFINIEYILGPVVEEFSDDIPDEMFKVTIAGGKYAIFETGNRSDKDNIPETLRMFSRCVFFGWIKENRERVDLMRFTFERYIDNKVYIYVPLKK